MSWNTAIAQPLAQPHTPSSWEQPQLTGIKTQSAAASSSAISASSSTTQGQCPVASPSCPKSPRPHASTVVGTRATGCSTKEGWRSILCWCTVHTRTRGQPSTPAAARNAWTLPIQANRLIQIDRVCALLLKPLSPTSNRRRRRARRIGVAPWRSKRALSRLCCKCGVFGVPRFGPRVRALSRFCVQRCPHAQGVCKWTERQRMVSPGLGARVRTSGTAKGGDLHTCYRPRPVP